MSFSGLLPEGVPAPSPCRCVCCGNDRRPLATSGVEIPGYGTVLVCVGTTAQPGCLLQVAVAAGCLLPGQVAQLMDEYEQLQQKVAALSMLVERRTEQSLEVVPVQEVVDLLSERLGVPVPS
jgi:hypothetical protein